MITIIIAKNKKEIKFKLLIKLNHNIYPMSTRLYSKARVMTSVKVLWLFY